MIFGQSTTAHHHLIQLSCVCTLSKLDIGWGCMCCHRRKMTARTGATQAAIRCGSRRCTRRCESTAWPFRRRETGRRSPTACSPVWNSAPVVAMQKRGHSAAARGTATYGACATWTLNVAGHWLVARAGHKCQANTVCQYQHRA